MNKYYKSLLKMFIIVSVLVGLYRVGAVRLLAFDMESTGYKVQMGNFNFTAGEKSSDTYILRDTAGELAPGQSDSDTYTVLAGFEYVASIIPFSLTISNTQVNFGTLSAGTPKTDTTDLTVSSGAAFGYKVTAIENNQLKLIPSVATYIVDTVGDNTDITPTNQGAWALSTTVGFGYSLANLTGTDAVFTSGYRQFADDSSSESPVNVMLKSGVTRESKVQVTYKVNINATQAAGNYENKITYILTGTF